MGDPEPEPGPGEPFCRPAEGKVFARRAGLALGEAAGEGFPGSDSVDSRTSPYLLRDLGESPVKDKGEAPRLLIMPFRALSAPTGDFIGDELGEGLLDLLPDRRGLRPGLGVAPGLAPLVFLFPIEPVGEDRTLLKLLFKEDAKDSPRELSSGCPSERDNSQSSVTSTSASPRPPSASARAPPVSPPSSFSPSAGMPPWKR